MCEAGENIALDRLTGSSLEQSTYDSSAHPCQVIRVLKQMARMSVAHAPEILQVVEEMQQELQKKEAAVARTSVIFAGIPASVPSSPIYPSHCC